MKYYIIVSWAQSARIADNLEHQKIPFKLSIITNYTAEIVINAEHLPAAQMICAGWAKLE